MGGILTDLLSWEWIFFVNVPVGIAGLVLAPILLTESRDAHGQSHDVPYGHALKLVSCLPADDVTLSLIPDGDHRLSRPEDIATMLRAVETLIMQAC